MRCSQQMQIHVRPLLELHCCILFHEHQELPGSHLHCIAACQVVVDVVVWQEDVPQLCIVLRLIVLEP